MNTTHSIPYVLSGEIFIPKRSHRYRRYLPYREILRNLISKFPLLPLPVIQLIVEEAEIRMKHCQSLGHISSETVSLICLLLVK